MANIWQGVWPYENTLEDGFAATAPVKSFPSNAFGLYDMAGNVWEIVADRYHPKAYSLRMDGAINPTGPDADSLRRLRQRLPTYVTRGGSFYVQMIGAVVATRFTASAGKRLAFTPYWLSMRERCGLRDRRV